jgi:hypothetical protein
MKIRILNYNDANNGSCLINWAILQMFTDHFKDSDIKFLDYAPLNRRALELFRLAKMHAGRPLFNFNRYITISNWIGTMLPIESYGTQSVTSHLQNGKFDFVVVSKPSWDITNEWSLSGFPTMLWLPMGLSSKKVAFGVSAHRSLPELVWEHRSTIRTILDSYSLIGVRDDWTYEIVKSSNTHTPIRKIPDPVFMYEFVDTDVDTILQEKGIDLSRPIVAFAAYGKSELFRELAAYFRRNGFQIIGLGMFNPHVDVNLGDILDPLQWADAFRRLSFCVTDRFHGTVLSLLANIPFVSMEPYFVKDTRNSKILDLLKNVEQMDCYADVYGQDFHVVDLIDKIATLQKKWRESYADLVYSSIRKKRSDIKQFLVEMKDVVI